MHPNRKFHIESRDEMEAIVRALGFGSIVVATGEGLRAVHVPVLIDGGRLRFHVSKGNAVHAALLGGCEALFVANGPHAYISPDDYGLEGRVPTWSYVAVELNGPVRALGGEALVAMLDDMAAGFEAGLAPRPPWSRDRITNELFAGLLKGITGFEMTAAEWRGTRKIDQDKPAEVRARLASALRERGETAMAALVEPSPERG